MRLITKAFPLLSYAILAKGFVLPLSGCSRDCIRFLMFDRMRHPANYPMVDSLNRYSPMQRMETITPTCNIFGDIDLRCYQRGGVPEPGRMGGMQTQPAKAIIVHVKPISPSSFTASLTFTSSRPSSEPSASSPGSPIDKERIHEIVRKIQERQSTSHVHTSTAVQPTSTIGSDVIVKRMDKLIGILEKKMGREEKRRKTSYPPMGWRHPSYGRESPSPPHSHPERPRFRRSKPKSRRKPKIKRKKHSSREEASSSSESRDAPRKKKKKAKEPQQPQGSEQPQPASLTPIPIHIRHIENKPKISAFRVESNTAKVINVTPTQQQLTTLNTTPDKEEDVIYVYASDLLKKSP